MAYRSTRRGGAAGERIRVGHVPDRVEEDGVRVQFHSVRRVVDADVGLGTGDVVLCPARDKIPEVHGGRVPHGARVHPFLQGFLPSVSFLACSVCPVRRGEEAGAVCRGDGPDRLVPRVLRSGRGQAHCSLFFRSGSEEFSPRVIFFL